MTKYLIISGHDYRTPRKANMHFIADELKQRGQVRFFSAGFSILSRIRRADPRSGLTARSNSVETVEGVECYLWDSGIHPGKLNFPFLTLISNIWFEIYSNITPHIFKCWILESSTVFIESGLGIIFLENIRKWNPNARVIYIASDDLETVGCDRYIIEKFELTGKLFDNICVTSRRMITAMPSGPRITYVPHGISADFDDYRDPSPYGPGLHAVSVGSMLFDPDFFIQAADLFPEITFHVIGPGKVQTKFPDNVILYPEMPFQRTIRYMAHASIGIAPYRSANLPDYLRDTSMKLIQYDHLSLPAVCPTFVCSPDYPLRYGYTPGDRSSIEAAIRQALASDRRQGQKTLLWSEVVDRILEADHEPPLPGRIV